MRIFIAACSILLLASCSQGTSPNEKESKEKETIALPSEEEQKPSKGKEKKQEQAEKEEEHSTDEKEYEVNEANWSIETIQSDEAADEFVLLTIDDAPDKHALEMAKKLKEMGAPAIFFVNGHFIQTEEKKQQLKEIHDLGFEIGNHTMTHADLKTLSEEEQYEEIVPLNDQIESIIGERPKFFRAPYGSNTDYSKQLASEEKMVLMNWTYGYDWEKEYQTKEAIQNIMLQSPYLKNGANLLMHDRDWTNEALTGIVQGLEEKGYSFVDPKKIKTID